MIYNWFTTIYNPFTIIHNPFTIIYNVVNQPWQLYINEGSSSVHIGFGALATLLSIEMLATSVKLCNWAFEQFEGFVALQRPPRAEDEPVNMWWYTFQM